MAIVGVEAGEPSDELQSGFVEVRAVELLAVAFVAFGACVGGTEVESVDVGEESEPEAEIIKYM